MDFTLKLPPGHRIDAQKKVMLEERFQMAFKSIIFKYNGNEVPYDKSAVFNIEYDDYANYLRLKTVSPQYPKKMQEEIMELLSRIFVSSSAMEVQS